MPRLSHAVTLACAIIVAGQVSAQETEHSVTATIADTVRATYEGERAFETVEFLDQYVRWPGNNGFDASIDHIAARLAAIGYVEESGASFR